MKLDQLIEEADSSYIIRMYHLTSYIRKCLKSIQDVSAASPRKVEAVVIDNGSSDDSVEIVSGLGIKVHPLPEKSVAMRNYGAPQSDGKYLCFVHSDCIVLQSWMRWIIEYACNGFNEMGVIGGGYGSSNLGRKSML